MRDFYMSFEEWFSNTAQPMIIGNKPTKLEMAYGDPVTDKQIRYAYGAFGVRIPPEFNRRQASEVINAAKDGDMERAHALTGGQPPAAPQPPVQPTPPPQTPDPTARTPQPQPNQGPWILATAKKDEALPDHNGVEHKIKEGQHVALKDNGDGTWGYATIWKGKLQWHNSHMPKDELSNRFTSVKPLQRAEKASHLAKATHEETNEKFELTEEQQDIADTFAKNKETGGPNHMVINALAGTGKTTMLQHLAENFGSKNEKWLYLVFGAKNGAEAREKFPPWMKKHIFTTHQYAGRVLDANKRVLPKTDRMADKSRSDKVAAIMDSPQYRRAVEEIGLTDWEDASKFIKFLYVKPAYNEFNKEVKKLAGLAKAYNADPDDAVETVDKILEEHAINTFLERVKEKLENDPNRDRANENVSEFMGINDFASYDFEKEIKSATLWLLDKSRHHGIDQEWTQTHEKDGDRWKKLRVPVTHNLRNLRDFDDDLWYAAQHADELDWTKPEIYEHVLVDEVQDFNMAQKKILQKLIENGANVVAVGDPNQSMYRFRGADANAFKDITNMLRQGSANPDNVEKPLTKNFRSKQGIIDHSNENTKVKNLQAGIPYDEHDPAHISNQEVKYDETIDRLGHEYDTLGEMKKQTAFIARTNAPLAKAAMDLLKHKIPFIIYGKDLSGEIMDVVYRVQNAFKKSSSPLDNNDDDINTLLERLNEFVENKKEKWGAAGKQNQKAGELKDLMEAQQAITGAVDIFNQDESVESKTIGDFIGVSGQYGGGQSKESWLRKRLGGTPEYFPDTPAGRRKKAEHKRMLEELNPVILTSAHKSKGLEFERVFELTPSLYPHPRAAKTGIQADLDQEENARYVAGTRAKDEYHIVDDTEDEED